MNFESYIKANDKIIVPPELIEKTVARMREAHEKRKQPARINLTLGTLYRMIVERRRNREMDLQPLLLPKQTVLTPIWMKMTVIASVVVLLASSTLVLISYLENLHEFTYDYYSGPKKSYYSVIDSTVWRLSIGLVAMYLIIAVLQRNNRVNLQLPVLPKQIIRKPKRWTVAIIAAVVILFGSSTLLLFLLPQAIIDSIPSLSAPAPTLPPPMQVKFDDPVIESVIRQQMQMETGSIDTYDLFCITELQIESRTVKSFKDLTNLPNLKMLILINQQLSDPSQLSQLKNLDVLIVSGCNLADASFIKKLTDLTILDISQNNLTDISFASQLKNLSYLNINDNKISDLTPLRDLTKLIKLEARNNPVLGWSPVEHVAIVAGKPESQPIIAITPEPSTQVPTPTLPLAPPTNQPIIAVNEIKLDKSSISQVINDSVKLSVTVSPSNATDKEVAWSSSNSMVAKVDSTGNVTAVGPGSAMITATCGARSDRCSVIVAAPAPTPSTIAVTRITLNRSNHSLNVGESFKLTATVSPSNATRKTLTWSSSNTSIVRVDGKGNVAVVGPGSATITAKCGEQRARCIVTVSAAEPPPEITPPQPAIIAVEEVKSNKSSLLLEIGEMVRLIATVFPDNATDKTLAWSSSKSSVATVDSKGKVKAVGQGTAMITVICNGQIARCAVTVD